MPKSKLKNAAKKRILTQSRNNDGRFLAADPEYNYLEYSDPELLVYESESSNEEEFNNGETELSEEEAERLVYENSSFYNIQWDNKASGGRLPYYSGGSKRTQQRKNKGLREAAQGSMSLDNFFKPVKKLEVKYEMSDSDISDSDIENNSSISEKINKLSNNLKDMRNMNAYEYLRLLAVHKYLAAIFNHEESHSRVKLSLEISQQVFQRGPWMARRIREWSKSWITTETLPVSKQGQRKYIPTLIDDEDVQSSCLRFIRTMGERITAEKFQNYVQNNVLPHVTSSRTSISLETARTWLRRLGLVYQRHQQGIYYDGHERPDVVQYRAIFLEKMKDLETLMPQFVGENMEIIINPEISEEKQMHILVTHDECTFYANDGRPSVWAPLGMLPLRKKGKGKALMISEFLTETRGRLTITSAEINELNLPPTFPQEARVIIKPGKNDDGWWNASDLLTQVANKAIPIFEATHPNCIGVFAFDNSTNHSAFASDALCTKNMNLYPGGKQSRLRDGWFINEQGEQITQPMIFPEDLPPDNSNYIFRGQQKGIQQVLRERNLWPTSGLKLKCGNNYYDPSAPNCCARHLLSAQPDFIMQKSALEELIVERGHVCVFYPKYHCELNFIERYWGAVKRYSREHCDYSWSGLQVTVPEALDSVSLTTIRRFARKAWRYMDAYRRGLTGRVAEYAVRKYRSHRRIPNEIDLELG